MIYLDFSATSPLLPEAKDAMLKVFDTTLGNPSALHTPGQNAHHLIEAARADIAKLINADPSEIIFTSGGSEANNTVIYTFRSQNIAISNIEHPSIIEPAKAYTNFTFLPVDSAGFLQEKALRSTLASKNSSALISIMLANNELGTIQPVKELAKLAHSHGTYFHTDATQALGKIPIDVKALDIDYLTISAHKIGGPVGIGALYLKGGKKAIKAFHQNFQSSSISSHHPPITYVSNQLPYTPLILGGHQEQGLRAGTTPVANIVGFGAAARYVHRHNLPGLYRTKVKPLRDLLAQRILTEIPYSSLNTALAGLTPLDVPAAKSPSSSSVPPPLTTPSSPTTALEHPSPRNDLLPHLLNASFQAAEGESIQLYLDALADIAVSTGSACASGDGKPSHVLMATTGDAEIAHSSIRFSLAPTTTEQDINIVMQYLPDIVKRLQDISTIRIKEKS